MADYESRTRWYQPPLPGMPTPEMDDVDLVNSPPHYNSGPLHTRCAEPIECIDVARDFDFNIGNVIKYLWRAGMKGDVLEDYRKAQWYLKDAIEQLELQQERERTSGA